MSVMEGQTFSQGPLRPIPIHLARARGLDPLNFRIPLPLDKPTKPAPPLWNPALDLRSPSKDSVKKETEHDAHLKPHASVSRSSKSSSSSSKNSSSSLPTTTVLTSTSSPVMSVPTILIPNDAPPSPVSLKTIPMVGASVCEHLQRHFPGGLDNPTLAVLASKGAFFPNLLANPSTIQPHPVGHPSAVPHHPHPGLSLSERHLSLQNALALAQSRAVMERLTSSHSQLAAGSLGHHRPHPHPHQHPSQQQRQQQLPTQLPNSNQTVSVSERPATFQNALALAQSRALVERVNSSQMLSPIMSIENPISHGYGRKLFPCPQCRYTTDRRNNLKRHMLTMHQTSSKMLECCGILFNTKASLREHAMIFHYHGYTCYFCGRRFCRKALLKRHLSVHNGQKDFVCNVCDYATSHKSNLERHRKVHSRQDDGKEGDESHRYHGDQTQHFHDEVKSNGSEAVSHDDMSSDELSVCSDFDDDIDVEINVHSD